MVEFEGVSFVKPIVYSPLLILVSKSHVLMASF